MITIFLFSRKLVVLELTRTTYREKWSEKGFEVLRYSSNRKEIVSRRINGKITYFLVTYLDSFFSLSFLALEILTNFWCWLILILILILLLLI